MAIRDGSQSFPANQVSGLVSIDYVVAEIQAELNDYGPTQRSRLLALAISAVRDFRLYDSGLVQIAYLDINEAGIAILPRDYIDYVQIGELTLAGNVRDFTLNPAMALNRQLDCGVPDRVMNPTMAVNNQNVMNAGVFFVSPVWGGNNIVPTFYGSSGGWNNGYYKVDKAAGVIQFNGVIPQNQIVLVYKSTGIGTTTPIPYEMIAAIKAHVHYARVKTDARVSLGQKQMYKDDLREERTKLRAFTQNFNLAEYLDALYRFKKQSPRP